MPEAVFAHREILAEVQRELVAYRAPADDRPHIRLVELLCEYIECACCCWQDGQWREDILCRALHLTPGERSGYTPDKPAAQRAKRRA